MSSSNSKPDNNTLLQMLLLCVFLVLTFFYCAFIFIPLERVAEEERKSRGHHYNHKADDEDHEMD